MMKRSLTLLLVCGETRGHLSWARPNGLEAPLDGEEFTLLKNRWDTAGDTMIFKFILTELHLKASIPQPELKFLV